MRTAYVADTGVFVRCGGPDNETYRRLRNALVQANTSLRIPRRVYEEIGGDPATDRYPSADIPHADGIDEGWITVADELDHADPLVSTVMDRTRSFIASDTGRDEDRVEKADAALVALAARILDSGEADKVVVLTTDKPAGRAAESVLSDRGFSGQVEFRYASETFLSGIGPGDFR